MARRVSTEYLLRMTSPPAHLGTRLQKPVSGKARRVQLQQKRATKRTTSGDGTAGAGGNASNRLTVVVGANGAGSSTHTRIGQRYRTPEQKARDNLHAGRMKLESRFVRLNGAAADDARQRAANERLYRPVDPSLAILREEELVPPKRSQAELITAGENDAAVDELTCPKRPKWRYTMTKAEVEKNEGACSSRRMDLSLSRIDALTWADLEQRASSEPGSPRPTLSSPGTKPLRRPSSSAI